MKLALFDLDNTLLNGDSDVLWCDFLIGLNLLDRTEFAARNADMESRYKAGTVEVAEFANFYTSTLAGKTPEQWQPYREQFLDEWIAPRISEAAHDLVKKHQDAGDLVILTTATNRFITELTANYLCIQNLIATELEVTNAIFTGKATGVLNMREGKPIRLNAWLASRTLRLEDFESTAYSDSINDLPLLRCANQAVAVNPDSRLKEIANSSGWSVIYLYFPRNVSNSYLI